MSSRNENENRTVKLLSCAAAGLALTVLAGCTDSAQRATYPPVTNSTTPLQPSDANGVVRADGNSAPTAPSAPASAETVIEAAPAPAVEGSPLDNSPPSFAETGNTETALNSTETPSATAEPAVQPVTREAMIGAWTVASGGTNCQIFLALTKWSGGYRAATRGCSGSPIANVQAWDVKSNRIVLVDSSGGEAASLSKTGDTKYAGSVSGGGAISFAR